MIPFAGLLAELRSRDFGVGLHEYRDLVLLASRWKGTDPIAFRDAIAALIARNRDDVIAIRELFDEWLEREAPAPAPPPSEPERVRWKVWHVAAIVLAAAVAIGALLWWSIDRARDDAPATQTDTGLTDTAYEPIPTPPPALPPEPREEANERPWILAAVLLVAALVASAVPETRKRQRQWARKYWKSVLAAKEGPHAYEQCVTPSAAPLPRHVVEDVATILGRAVESDTVGETLDVEESLRVTLREGLRPHLVFEPPPRNVPVIMLIDAAWQMRPWRRKVDYFVSELTRQGVVLDRWYFDGDPLRVSRTPHDLLVPLEQLAATRSESPLMVLGSGQTLADESIERLQRVLKKWTFRTWVHPVGNPQYWRRELARLPLRMWPMTAAGLRAAAVEVARNLDSEESPLGVAAPRAVTRDDVQRMKELIAHVPHPSLELAEELRRRFARDVPEEVMLFLGAEGVFYGESIRLPPEQLQRLMESASAEPEREREVRRYLLEVLRDSEPVEGSVAHLRWQLDEALHRLRLDDPTAVETLRSLAEGPLKDEVAAALAVVQDPRVAPAAPSVPSTLPERPPEGLGKRPPLWAWPRWQVALPAAALALTAALLLGRWAGRGEGAIIPHVRDAYTLTWVEPKLYVKHMSPTLETASLFRGGKLVWQFQKGADEPDYEPTVEERGAWFDVRAPLPRGNLAVSDPVWVPAAKPPKPIPPPDTAPGRLTIGSLPRNVRLQDLVVLSSDGRDTRLLARSTELAPGRYVVALDDDFYVWSRSITIEPAKETRVDVDAKAEYGTVLLRGFDARAAQAVQKQISGSRLRSSPSGWILRARTGIYPIAQVLRGRNEVGAITVVAGRRTEVGRDDSPSERKLGAALVARLNAAIDDPSKGCRWPQVQAVPYCDTRACLMKKAVDAAYRKDCETAKEYALGALCDDALLKRLQATDAQALCAVLRRE